MTLYENRDITDIAILRILRQEESRMMGGHRSHVKDGRRGEEQRSVGTACWYERKGPQAKEYRKLKQAKKSLRPYQHLSISQHRPSEAS